MLPESHQIRKIQGGETGPEFSGSDCAVANDGETGFATSFAGFIEQRPCSFGA
jgi:hypothetical protein